MRALLMLVVIFTIPSYGQIVINQDDMPQAGDVLTFSLGNVTGSDPALTGEEYFWNYEDLTVLTQEVDTFVSVEDTPFLYQFFFNNGFLYPDYEADVALSGEDITIGTISATNVYNYFKNDADGYRSVGVGSTISGLPQSIQYDPIDWIYEFPLNYGNQFEGNSYLEFSLPGVGFISQDKNTVTEVDGWGQLVLPIGTYETLRVKKIVNETDSIYNEVIGLGFGIDVPEQIVYQWLAEGESAPILEITTSLGQTLGARFKDELIPVGISDIDDHDLVIYPNPSSSYVRISTEQLIEDKDISVVNELGQMVLCPIEISQDVILIRVNDLQSGVYHIRIFKNGNPYTQRFVVE